MKSVVKDLLIWLAFETDEDQGSKSPKGSLACVEMEFALLGTKGAARFGTGGGGLFEVKGSSDNGSNEESKDGFVGAEEKEESHGIRGGID